MAVNLIVQSGVVKGLALRYDAGAKPELRWTLVQQENDWNLYLPCCAAGSAAERLAGEIEDGMHIIVTSGKLVYRKRANKTGVEQSRLEILTWAVERLQGPSAVECSGTPEDTSGSEEPALNLAPSGAPEMKKPRKPRYQWKPGHVN